MLLSTIGTRGDVQPVLALGQALRAAGQDVTIVAPPDFASWIESFGIHFVAMGPPVRALPPSSAGPLKQPHPEAAQNRIHQTVAEQFEVLGRVVPGHQVVVAAGVLQFALRSVAELHGIPYVFAAYCPTVLPSPNHPPAQMGAHHAMTLSVTENQTLWSGEIQRWEALFGAAITAERSRLGLPAFAGVLRHIQTERPWLAADPVLAPADGMEVVQTGAWRPQDSPAFPASLERFLEEGTPPVYLGFGSMRPGPEVGRELLEAARAVGRRAIVSRGWGGLAPEDDGNDWIAIDDVAHDALFPRVAAVVHHGGAGTTTSTAMAGVPQVIVPHHYDQPYWAHRVQVLGLGVALPGRPPDSDAVALALEGALQTEVVEAAEETAGRLVRDGAKQAAERLIALAG